MLYVFLAILCILLFFAFGLTEQSCHGSSKFLKNLQQRFFKDKGREYPLFPSAPTILVFFLSIFYGVLGTKIYTTLSPKIPYKDMLFWTLYPVSALIAYGFLPTWLSIKLPKKTTTHLRFIASVLQLCLFPLQLVFCRRDPKQHARSSTSFQSQLSEALSAFDNLIVREVMIPKVDIFALPEETTLKEALLLVSEEGYSRVPVYKKNLDNITGVLLVKDLFLLYTSSHDLSQPIASVAKPPFYAPEIKKASSLLQEFRQKHRHLAIIVNEYGFTEGIATMEDIIEEIIGEIADEHDVQEDTPYKKIGNSWIVDGRMNISDAEEYFNLKIDHENSYDTLGGHVFHKVGAVPQKGMRIHHENFDIEIITCTERNVGKLKITPRKRKFNIS
ncbi:Hemolysin C,magnesium/cobalt efflux protein CorC,Putative Mg2 and Co2 transporter CorC,gliding motility-associated protein GldE,Transporter associated domain [Chlamydia serpentis]|uniref:Hemolysin C,magnesium/cobalt efflux protein CorC,Putative Mg2 and Co2 transporter CorC,gliding motility-associated protein GldE,Transporter associated domain n=1 Tax=Chlamydia serpentis TaxID=1967782 RepID=A0A2R8FB15_9CHLA|nr:hemolysin family protein [Chlamydia serpentis]SPN73630.1 Hemolysin C,magnesium/cobalt efflux protein CorC,Putative Mg2 and Co2 transporter CorC,gliding motility-associated protein GldE,Transporter associated domain [Chlamydia serpentis]